MAGVYGVFLWRVFMACYYGVFYGVFLRLVLRRVFMACFMAYFYGVFIWRVIVMECI